MKNYIFFCIVLCLLNNCTIYAADSNKEVILIESEEDKTSFLTLHQQCLDDFKNDKWCTELETCKNLADVETCLYKEAKKASSDFFNACNVPVEEQNKFYKIFENKLILYESNNDNQVVIHDERHLGKELIQKTKVILAQFNINPDKVNIIYNEKIFKEDPTLIADVKDTSFSYASNLSHILITPISTIYFNANKKPNTHTIARTITTIQENHQYQFKLALAICKSHTKVPNQEIKNFYRAWGKILAKQADLFPLIRLPKEVKMHVDFKTDRYTAFWNRKRALALSPTQKNEKQSLVSDYKELLPYIYTIDGFIPEVCAFYDQYSDEKNPNEESNA